MPVRRHEPARGVRGVVAERQRRERDVLVQHGDLRARDHRHAHTDSPHPGPGRRPQAHRAGVDIRQQMTTESLWRVHCETSDGAFVMADDVGIACAPGVLGALVFCAG